MFCSSIRGSDAMRQQRLRTYILLIAGAWPLVIMLGMCSILGAKRELTDPETYGLLTCGALAFPVICWCLSDKLTQYLKRPVLGFVLSVALTCLLFAVYLVLFSWFYVLGQYRGDLLPV